MIRAAVVGLGKMGISHLAILRAHPQVDVVAICDNARYVPDVVSKYAGLPAYTDLGRMLEQVSLDAIVIATPTATHAPLVTRAMQSGLHVFCEKPLTLDPHLSATLADQAEASGRVGQVGYHNRFVATFNEAHRLISVGALGRVHHVLAEAYGPVVLRAKGGTWRARRTEGGSCLFDYAAHPLDLLCWYFGEPSHVSGSVLGRVFSSATDDEVYGTLHFDEGITAQVSVNWSDESVRKMSTRLSIWGTAGRLVVDRQECRAYLRDSSPVPDGYDVGWNVRYATDLTSAPWFYLRGEEYSTQIDHFVQCVLDAKQGQNSFRSATAADRVMAGMIADEAAGFGTSVTAVPREEQAAIRAHPWREWWRESWGKRPGARR